MNRKTKLVTMTDVRKINITNTADACVKVL